MGLDISNFENDLPAVEGWQNEDKLYYFINFLNAKRNF
jgi:hypothetical protein